MIATNWQCIGEMKAMNGGSNAEETPNSQVTIRWTDETKTMAITNTSDGEMDSFQCTAGKVLLHKEEKYR